jgi:hypothetical protein
MQTAIATHDPEDPARAYWNLRFLIALTNALSLRTRIDQCRHTWSPAVHLLHLAGGREVYASACLRCGVWLQRP